MDIIKYLLIDDERNIKAHIICRRPDDGIKALVHLGPFDVLYLDHDMGIEPKIEYKDPEGVIDFEYSGYGVACFIERYPEYAPESVEIVSSNPSGVKRIAQAFNTIYKFKSTDGKTFSKHDLNKNVFDSLIFDKV